MTSSRVQRERQITVFATGHWLLGAAVVAHIDPTPKHS
jgi:hypothetical protein